MTIKEYLLECEITSKMKRIERLEKINAPKAVIDEEKRILAEMESGEFDVEGDIEALNEEMKNREVKEGRNGRVYVLFNDGKVNYSPTTRLGRYIVYTIQ